MAGLALAAFLYASVGHGGASGYLAVMSFAGLAPATMKPAALALNVVVAGIGSWIYLRAGAFDWKVFWPFALVSIPMAYLGGALHVPAGVFKPLVGVALLRRQLGAIGRDGITATLVVSLEGRVLIFKYDRGIFRSGGAHLGRPDSIRSSSRSARRCSRLPGLSGRQLDP